MPDVIIPRRPLSVRQLCANDENAIQCFLGNNPEVRNDILIPGRAYCTADFPVSPRERAIYCPINALPAPARENLACVIDDYGDETHILASFNDQYRRDLAEYERSQRRLGVASHSNTLAGSAAAVMTARHNGFFDALLHYQQTLERLHNLNGVGRGKSAQRSQLRREAIAAYEVLNQRFQYELHRLVPEGNRGLNRRGNPRNKGNALSNPQRGITLAERSKPQGIHVADGYRQGSMARLATAVRYAARGAVFLDAGLRINTVRNEYQVGGDWQRETFAQTAGFSGSLASGAVVGGIAKAGLVAAKITLMASPAGWCLVIGSAAVFGFGLAAGVDAAFQRGARALWDTFR